MPKQPVILFVIEGEARDFRFVNEMTRCFFRGRYQTKIINLPAAQNIYMLYQKLAEDNFDTDIVEVLRDTVDGADRILNGIKRQDIDQVFMFFDYDIHQNNLSCNYSIQEPADIIKLMLEAFDNETENGKLYISYPMVEALYDYVENTCEAFSNCFIPIDKANRYKTISTDGNKKSSIHFSITEWEEVLSIYPLRLKCLWNIENIDFHFYRCEISPLNIFEKQNTLKIKENKIFILSCFPEFLFDYFPEKFWNSKAKLKRVKLKSCSKFDEQ